MGPAMLPMVSPRRSRSLISASVEHAVGRCADSEDRCLDDGTLRLGGEESVLEAQGDQAEQRQGRQAQEAESDHALERACRAASSSLYGLKLSGLIRASAVLSRPAMARMSPPLTISPDR